MQKTYDYQEILKSDFSVVKKNKCILFLVSSSFFVPQGISIINLKRKSDIYDVIAIVEFDLTNEQKQFLTSIEPRVEFIHYERTDLYNEFEIPENNSLNPETNLTFVSAKYGKHIIFLLLKLYNKILLIEQDLIICHNLDDLFENQGSAFTALMNWNDHFKNLLIRNNKCLSCLSDLDLNEQFYTTNGGLYYVDGSFFDANIYSNVLNFKNKIVKAINGFDPAIDEFVITYIIQKFSSCFRFIDNRFYNSLVHDIDIDDDVKIIHALGSLKVWNNKFIYHFYPEWKISYQKWIELGGQKIAVPIITHQELLIDSIFNDLKLRILNDLMFFTSSFNDLLFMNESLQSKDKISLSFFNKRLEISLVVNGFIPEDSFFVEYALGADYDLLNKLKVFFNYPYSVSETSIIKTGLFGIKDFRPIFTVLLRNFKFLNKFLY